MYEGLELYCPLISSQYDTSFVINNHSPFIWNVLPVAIQRLIQMSHSLLWIPLCCCNPQMSTLLNKALWLVKTSYMTFNTQSEYTNSASLTYTMLNFVYGIGSRLWYSVIQWMSLTIFPITKFVWPFFRVRRSQPELGGDDRAADCRLHWKEVQLQPVQGNVEEETLLLRFQLILDYYLFHRAVTETA